MHCCCQRRTCAQKHHFDVGPQKIKEDFKDVIGDHSEGGSGASKPAPAFTIPGADKPAEAPKLGAGVSWGAPSQAKETAPSSGGGIFSFGSKSEAQRPGNAPDSKAADEAPGTSAPSGGIFSFGAKPGATTDFKFAPMSSSGGAGKPAGGFSFGGTTTASIAPFGAGPGGFSFGGSSQANKGGDDEGASASGSARAVGDALHHRSTLAAKLRQPKLL